MKLPVSETLIHEAVIALLRFKAKPGVLYWHCPNGESRSERTGAKLKRMGVLPGVPDICLLLPDGQAAFLEVKAPRGRLSDAQEGFQIAAINLGARYAVVRSVEEADAFLSVWGVLRGSTHQKQAA